jgi:hypothetical protein
LLSVRSEAALANLRVDRAIERLGGHDSAALWAELERTWAAVRAASVREDAETLRAAVTEHGRLIDCGVSEEERWEELARAARHKADLAGREWKRLADLESLITQEQAMVLVANLVSIVQAHVTDRATLAAIPADISGLVGGPAPRRAGDDDAERGTAGPESDP